MITHHSTKKWSFSYSLFSGVEGMTKQSQKSYSDFKVKSDKSKIFEKNHKKPLRIIISFNLKKTIFIFYILI